MRKASWILWATGSAIVALTAVIAWSIHDSGEQQGNLLPGRPRGGSRRPVPHADRMAERIAMLEQMAAADPNYRWKIPLEFFGKVVDQDGHPVPGATARISLTIPDENNQRERKVVTGPDGTFQFGGCNGEILMVNIGTPAGYMSVESTCYGDYNYAVPGEFNFHVPDPAKPVVFKVWKLVDPKPLVSRDLGFDFRENDGKIHWTSLLGMPDGVADLGVCVLSREFVKSDQSWRGLKVIAGSGCGVLECGDGPRLFAPESGYIGSIAHTFTGNPGEYLDDRNVLVRKEPFEFNFYFRGRDGKYSIVSADVTPVQTYEEPNGEVRHYNGSVRFKVKSNPWGSRSLEGSDPSK